MAVIEPELTLMVAVEPLKAVAATVASPVLLTVTTEELLEVQVADVVISRVELSEKVAVAVNCCDCPAVICALPGEMVMLDRVWLLTVRLVVAFTLPSVPVMVVVPRATPVARPVLSMVAMLVVEELQLTFALTSRTLLSPNLPLAVNC